IVGNNYTNIEALKQIYTNKGITFIVTWNKLYKRHLFNDIRFEEGRIHEDEFMAHRILHKGLRVTYLPIVLYFYLQRDSGIIGSGFSLKKLDAVYACKDRVTFFKEIKHLKLRQKAEYNYVVILFSYYIKVKKECYNYNFEIKKLRKDFWKSICSLLINPYFNLKEKTLWVMFLIHPTLFEFYASNNFYNNQVKE
ncbi:hypothetical protein, partial [Virgibacillus sp. DJP39]|uniref:hypothetical protein n=1 Tax=Virgibacillus sp. DJP39 TaxID=3409790 RepID=UPI003BB50D7B